MARLLIIEDDASLRELLQEALGLGGHAVDVADGHSSALAMLEHERFDLVVTDGIEFKPPYGATQSRGLQACQRAARLAPVVLFTGYAEARRLHAAEHGLAAIWLKPMGLAELLAGVHALVRLDD